MIQTVYSVLLFNYSNDNGEKTLRRIKVLSVCLILLLVPGEVSSIPVQESKNLGSANSDFNSLTMVLGDNADILRTLPFVVFEAIFGAYQLAVFELDMGTL